MVYTKEQFIRDSNERLAKSPLIIEMARELVARDKSLEGMTIEELIPRIPLDEYIARIWPLIRWPKFEE
jgi:hypothetical protein